MSDKEINKEDLLKAITIHLSKAYTEIHQAELIANEYNLSFDWGLAYGMGGYYNGGRGEWISSTEQCN